MLPIVAGMISRRLWVPLFTSPHYDHQTRSSDVFGSSSFGTPLGLLLGELQGKVSLLVLQPVSKLQIFAPLYHPS